MISQPHVTTIGKPRMLHRADCWHPPVGSLVPAKSEHLSLPACAHCADAEDREALAREAIPTGTYGGAR